MKKYYIKTYGCQMNTHDSEKVAGLLEMSGLREAPTIDQTDLLVINTCSVRQAAEDSLYGLAPKVAQLKTINPKAKVVVIGCVVGSVRGERQRYSEKELLNKIPWADYLLETKDLTLLPQILETLKDIPALCPVTTASGKARIQSDSWIPDQVGDDIPPKRQSGRQAFVSISTGCDNFCTFCVVPYARGEEKSRTKKDILQEIKQLVEAGFTEITLLGQNVNSWGITDLQQKLAIRTSSKEKLPFAKLLREIHKIEPVEKISFMSSNPFDFTLDLVETLKLPKIERYLHLAVQSGDDEVLRRMNRRHTRKEFLDLLGNIRTAVPDIRIGTDLIVGFPGETEEQFMNTVDLCRKAQFTLAFISMYSNRRGTNADKFFPDNVPLSEKRRRHKILTEVIKKSKLKNKNYK